MQTLIDGSYTVAQTQSAVNITEATFYRLVSLEADPATTDNVATFAETADIVQTSLLELAAGKKCADKGSPPSGQWVCCADDVYVGGGKKPVAGYR